MNGKDGFKILLAFVCITTSFGQTVHADEVPVDMVERKPAAEPVVQDWQPTPPQLFIGRCQPNADAALPGCKLPFTEPNVIAYETEISCGASRNYLSKEIGQIPAQFRSKRANNPEAHFPDTCIAYALRNFEVFAYENKVGSFASCGGETGFPAKGNLIPCVTQDYTQAIYNSFVDVTDCLAIPQKEILPKLWNESAFHVNTINSTEGAWDGGVGQLTSSAIRSVIMQREAGSATTELDYHLAEMRKSGKASCQRILTQASALKAVAAESKDRCGLLDTPANPLRNLLYMGIYYRTMVEQLTGISYRAGKEQMRDASGNWSEWSATLNSDLGRVIGRSGIKEKLQKLGIQNPSANYIRQILVTLSFNAGQQHALLLLNSYLDARIAEKLTLSDADLDFMNTDTRGLRDVMVGPKDETAEAKKIRLAKLDARRKSAHREPLPIFMRVSQTVGSPGYLSVVSFFRAKKYDRELGANLCTERGFMQHSR
ncbi:MAG: hypothetical protein V4736_04955 [Bdellovibrionota bacterium]